jgi:hypothetical protein
LIGPICELGDKETPAPLPCTEPRVGSSIDLDRLPNFLKHIESPASPGDDPVAPVPTRGLFGIGST